MRRVPERKERRVCSRSAALSLSNGGGPDRGPLPMFIDTEFLISEKTSV